MDILIVENEKAVAATLKKQLSKIARQITVVDSYDFAKYEILTKKHDVVILDHQLSSDPNEKQGLDLLREIRFKKNPIPIILLTARDVKEVSSWESLNSGADDFVKKPYNLKDLIARIKLAYRKTFQCNNNSRNVLIHNELELNLDFARLKIDDQERPLGKINFLLLKKFMQYPYKLFSSEDLIEYLWGSSSLFDRKSLNTLRVNISALKQFLGRNHDYIHNRYAYGYIFDDSQE